MTYSFPALTPKALSASVEQMNVGPLMRYLLEKAALNGHSYADLAALWHCDEEYVQALADGVENEMFIPNAIYEAMADDCHVAPVRIKDIAGLVDISNLGSEEMREILKIQDFYVPTDINPERLDKAYKDIPRSMRKDLSVRIPSGCPVDEAKLLTVAYYEQLTGLHLIPSDPLSTCYRFLYLKALEKAASTITMAC